jgi:hypothetical protein
MLPAAFSPALHLVTDFISDHKESPHVGNGRVWMIQFPMGMCMIPFLHIIVLLLWILMVGLSLMSQQYHNLHLMMTVFLLLLPMEPRLARAPHFDFLKNEVTKAGKYIEDQVVLSSDGANRVTGNLVVIF